MKKPKYKINMIVYPNGCAVDIKKKGKTIASQVFEGEGKTNIERFKVWCENVVKQDEQKTKDLQV